MTPSVCNTEAVAQPIPAQPTQPSVASEPTSDFEVAIRQLLNADFEPVELPLIP